MVHKMSGKTQDITQQNVQCMKELFPEIMTDGEKIDFDMLKTILGEIVDEKEERYQFTWHGKKQTILGAQQPSKGTLRPVPEKSESYDTTENLYIEGDNLEVLKLLQKSYNGKVKVIYIDPPYNTGKDFVYKDNFKDGMQNYLEQTGQVDSDGNIISTNAESNGRFHTDWLNMMYARLKLARNLLTSDGVIFISIDSNEQANLKKVCDEIFGENNLVSEVIWEKKFAPQNDAKYFSLNHEYVLIYAKNKKDFKRNLLPMSDEQIARYKNVDNDSRGPWQSDNLTVGTYSAAYDYEIETPNGTVISPPNGKSWRVSKEKLKELIKDNRIWFGEGGGNTPRLKRFLSEVQQGRVPISLWKYEEVGHTQEASNELRSIFEGKKVFDYPKPIRLVEQMLRIATNHHDIVLDFFSGAATTAHSVMKLNAEDDGKRKFIMVQLPEELDSKSEAYKEGYRTICDIGQERIKRAGKKIKQELLEKQPTGMVDENVVDPDKLDIGFKVLKLDSSNIREWNIDFESLENNLNLFESPFMENRSELDIVYEIMLKQGLELTYPMETFAVDDRTVYDIAFGNLFICLSDNINTDVAEAIIARRDNYGIETSSVIFSDAGFNDNDSEKLNCIERLKDAGYPEDNLLTI